MIEQNIVLFSNEEDFLFYKSIDELKDAIKNGTGHPYLRLDLPDLERWVGVKIGTGTVRKKQFLRDLKRDTRSVSSWIDQISAKINDADDKIVLRSTGNQGGTSAIISLFERKAFNYAKPPSLLKGLIGQATGPNDLVLDFFAGSATTAQAVMELNADDGGDRRFIMVSSTEATQDDPTKNVCREITAERIRRINASDEPGYVNLTAEFAYLRCRKLRFEDLDYEDGLTPSETWAALESAHQLPLTPYTPAPWTAHETETITVVYVDRFASDLIPWLRERSRARRPTFVYSWAPGQIRDRLDGADVEVRSVHDTLVARFRQ